MDALEVPEKTKEIKGLENYYLSVQQSITFKKVSFERSKSIGILSSENLPTRGAFYR